MSSSHQKLPPGIIRDIANAALEHSGELLAQWFPQGTVQGGEYCVGSIQGEPGSSLSINLSTGKGADFASGEPGFCDLVDVYRSKENCSMSEAALAVAQQIGFAVKLHQVPQESTSKPLQKSKTFTKQPDSDEEWRHIEIVPQSAPEPPLQHAKLGKPTASYSYRNEQGELMFIVHRYNLPDGGKQIRPLTLWRHLKTSVLRWRWKASEFHRPLYGVERFIKKPSSVVIVVEGENCADKLQKILAEEFVVLTWAGGSKAWKRTNWMPLKGRKVILWPDNDKPGADAMNGISTALLALGAPCQTLVPTELKPNAAVGWDCADAIDEGWGAAQLLKLFETPPPASAETAGKYLSARASEFFYRKKQKDFLQEYPTGECRPISEAKAKAAMQLESAVLGLPWPNKHQINGKVYQIIRDRAIDYDGPLPGYSKGLHEEGVLKLYCTAPPTLLRTKFGGATIGTKWPIIHEIMRRMFLGDEVGERQFLTLLATLKKSVSSLNVAMKPPNPNVGRRVQPGQALAIVGPRDSMKSLLAKSIIAPLLGNRIVDAYKALTAEAEGFNAEMLSGEVWLVDDREHSTDIRTRLRFGANLKSFCYGGAIGFHPKHQTPITLMPWGRVIILCNDTAENLSVLPVIKPDIADKIHILKCNQAKPPVANRTEKERAAFDATIAAELPFFAGWLEQWEMPDSLADDRSGVKTFMHPEVLATLRMLAPEAAVAEAIVAGMEAQRIDNPTKKTAAELYEALTQPGAYAARQMQDLLRHNNTLGTYLGRMADQREAFEAEYGLRVMRSTKSTGRPHWELLKVN